MRIITYKMDNNQHFIHALALIFSVLFVFYFVGCNPTFDDEKFADVQKTQLLSIILDKPEAAPGDTVTASFLMVDEEGPLDPPLQLWMLNPPDSSVFASGGIDFQSGGEDVPDAGNTSELDMSLIGFMPTFTFLVPPEEKFEFNEDGLAPLLLTLVVAREDIGFDFNAPEKTFAEFDSLLAEGKIELSLRTLVVSKREKMNRNPRVLSITAGRGEDSNGDRRPVPFVASDKSAATRQAAANGAYVFELSEPGDLYFTVEVEDEGDMELGLRYSWVSTDGDFGNLRAANQNWNPPMYVWPITDDALAIENAENANVREDLNLYPIWLILRDNGEPNQLGQTWVEFYVRVVDYKERLDQDNPTDGDSTGNSINDDEAAD